MMTGEQSRRWIGLIGLATEIVILALVCLAVVSLYSGTQIYQEPAFHWSDTVMRLLFGSSR
jgi:hypothetical protein